MGDNKGELMAKAPRTVGDTEKRALVTAVNKLAYENNWNPTDLLTAISFETAGTFDKAKKGPTTFWGQHQGLIQWGRPQRAAYDVDVYGQVEDQVRAIGDYLKSTGVKPGDGLMQMYAAINAGNAKKTGASDAKNGGTWGTVKDKVEKQMGAHREKAAALFEKYGSPASLNKTATGFGVGPNSLAQPTLPPIDDMTRQAYYRDKNFNPIATPSRGAPARAANLADQYSQYQRSDAQPRNLPVPQTAPRPSQTITPNKVNTFTFAPIDPARFAPQASAAELANQYSQYQRGTPATAPKDIAPSRPSVGIDPARFAPAQSPAQLANQYSQYQRGTVPAQAAAPARTTSIDPARFNNTATPQPNMTPNDIRNSYHNGLAGRLNPPSFATGPTTSQSVRDAQAGLAKSNVRDQFVRDVLRTGVQVELAPPSVNVDRGRFAPGPSKAELANQYSQYGNRSISAPQNSSMYDMVDIPHSATIADQYRSYGAGKIAPQVASTATQAAPVAPVQQQRAPTTVAPRAPNVAPSLGTPQAITDAAKQRFDTAKPGIFQGIPPSDIYDENAPGRSGFRGFGAGGFLGNLLTGNFGNMAGIERTSLPGILGVIQNVVQGLGGPQQAAQAVQTVAPALGQVMGMAPAQAAAKAGNNMVIGRDASGRIGWASDGALSSGAANAGWMSNNPERNYGGYGGGYDPTPV